MRKIIFLLGFLFFAGCNGDREPEPVTIAVSLAGEALFTATQYYQGIDEALQNRSDTVAIRTAMIDHKLQSRHIDTLLTLDPDVFVIEITDQQKGDELIAKIKNANVPVIGFNRLAKNQNYDLIITPDYKSIAQSMAEKTAEYANGNNQKIIMLHDPEFGAQNSLIVDTYLASLKDFDNLTFSTHEVNYTITDDRHKIEIPETTLDDADIIVCSTPSLTSYIATSYHNAKPSLLVGFGTRETFEEFGHINALLFDLQPFDTGVRIAESAIRYTRGEFRHYDGNVFQFGENIFPVVYTPHRVVLPDQQD